MQDEIEVRDLLQSILDSALDALITVDLQGRVVEFNQVAAEVFGYDREFALGRRISTLIIPPDLREAHEAGMSHFRRTGEGPVLNETIEITGMRSGGAVFPVEMTIVPFEMAGSQYFTATIRDITSRREQEEKLKASVARERLLRRELDHRVKNTLSHVLSLCKQASKNASADRPIVEALRDRIRSFSQVHELISEIDNTGIQIRQLITRTVGSYLGEMKQRLELSGPGILINSKAAVSLAIVLNELAMNAMKYGALAHAGGRIELSWEQRHPEEGGIDLILNWSEHHSGPVPERISGGFGTRFITQAVPFELGGVCSLESAREGIVFRAEIPMRNIEFSAAEDRFQEVPQA